MIYGSIDKSGLDQHHALKAVLDYIRQTNFSKFSIGIRNNLDEDNLYFTVFEYDTKPKILQKAEVHRKYIDIHYILFGEEILIVGTENSGILLLHPYSTEQDVEIYENIADEKKVVLHKKDFLILFPGEVHSPGITLQENFPTTVRKVVFKILASNLKESVESSYKLI